MRAHVKARESGFKLIIGSEVTLKDGGTLVLLAQDKGGYANLCRLISQGRLRSDKGESAVSWDEVCAYAQGLLALWGGEQSALTAVSDPAQVAGALRDGFGDRIYAMIARHRREEEVALRKLDESRLAVPPRDNLGFEQTHWRSINGKRDAPSCSP